MKHLKGKMAKNEVLPEIVKSCIAVMMDLMWGEKDKSLLNANSKTVQKSVLSQVYSLPR